VDDHFLVQLFAADDEAGRSEGRKPTLVRMTRSGATSTLASGTGTGGATAVRRAAQPASQRGADASNSRRESSIPLWYRGDDVALALVRATHSVYIAPARKDSYENGGDLPAVEVVARTRYGESARVFDLRLRTKG
jgi:hypothetical protein